MRMSDVKRWDFTSNVKTITVLLDMKLIIATNSTTDSVLFKHLSDMIDGLPLFLEGKVCKGFGRGSKELGCPTANFEDEVEKLLPKGFPSGIYFGWAQVDGGSVYKMVMSIGWNPFFKNVKRTIETHILHEFPCDFYDSTLKVVVLDYIRPEKNFTSKEALVDEIHHDISIANEKLNETVHSKFQHHEFFYKDFNASGDQNIYGSLNGSSVHAKI